MARPGIMVYFDIMEALKKLPDADKGRLFWAMLEYGKSGTVPELDGLALELAWEFVKPKIDKDEAEYNLSVKRRQYATFCRERKKKGEPEISFDEWLKTSGDCEDHRPSMMTNDNQWYPTTTTNPTTTITTSTSTAAAATTSTNETEVTTAAAVSEENQLKQLHGPLGQGVVYLSDNQLASLLDEIGLEAFDRYVKRLADFIIEKKAHVNNHYETILKWHKEDSGLDNK